MDSVKDEPKNKGVEGTSGTKDGVISEEEVQEYYHKEPLRNFKTKYGVNFKNTKIPTPMEQFETRSIPNTGIWLEIDCNTNLEKRIEEWYQSPDLVNMNPLSLFLSIFDLKLLSCLSLSLLAFLILYA